VLAGAITVAACAGTDDVPSPGTSHNRQEATVEFISSNLARQHAAGTFEDVVEADTRFALDLLRTLATEEENLFLSPYSIATALSMTLPGARGKTEREMATVLGADTSDAWHRARNGLDRSLMREREGIDDLEPLRLNVTNSIWGQSDYPFEEMFLDLLAAEYGAGLGILDFIGSPEPSRATINSWVKEKTQDRIPELLAEGSIDSTTRLVLTNAIHFKASWIHQFEESATRDLPFAAPSGSVDVPTMHGNPTVPYGVGNGWQAARLPYAGGASMLLIAPDEGEIADFTTTLDLDTLLAIRDGLTEHAVDLRMPKLEVETAVSLADTLKTLGMTSAFAPPRGESGADFSGITAERELFVHDVVHQANVTVDEEGTEAAAATAVLIGLTSAPPPAAFHLDRPFLLLIEDEQTGAILFAGQVVDPSA
jgi:serpin B